VSVPAKKSRGRPKKVVPSVQPEQVVLSVQPEQVVLSDAAAVISTPLPRTSFKDIETHRRKEIKDNLLDLKAALCEVGGEHIQKYGAKKAIVATIEIIINLKKSLEEKYERNAGLEKELANLRIRLWAAQSK